MRDFFKWPKLPTQLICQRTAMHAVDVETKTCRFCGKVFSDGPEPKGVDKDNGQSHSTPMTTSH